MKRLLGIHALFCLFALTADAAELSTYPTLNLSKGSGVDASGNVGLIPIQVPPSCAVNNPASYALYFNLGAVGCSNSVLIGPNNLTINGNGAISFPEGGFYNANQFSVGVPTTITGLSASNLTFPLSFPFLVTDANIAGGQVAAFLAPNSQNNGGANIYFGIGMFNWDVAFLAFNYVADGSRSNNICLGFYSNFQCVLTVDTHGFSSTVTLSTSGAGSTSAPTLALTTCGANCGFLGPSSNQMGMVVNGAYIWDVGINNTTAFMNFDVGYVPKIYTVGTLPVAPPTLTRAGISNNNVACSYGGTPTAGGTTFCTVEYNGSAWVIR